ncbi:MAG: EVE domain-containing protein [Roseimicrobium sp.]
MVPTMRYWLLKSEPDVFSFDDLKKRPKRMEPWNGVRNYQVRNMMRDQMREGDLGLFYHSSCEVPGVAGVLRVASEAKPDPTQFDVASEYFDKGSTPEEPRWLLVDVAWEADFKHFVPLTALRAEPLLANMLILRKGNRLSITEVDKSDFDLVCRMGGKLSAP